MSKLRLSGVVGWDITADAVSQFLESNDDKDITIFLNSPGGNVMEGLEIYNLLRASGRNITTVLTGIVASMGSILFLAGDKRIAMTGTMYMIHKPSGVKWGDADDLRKEAELLDKMQGNMQKIYEERANIENLEVLINEETWFDVDEMKKFNIVNSDEKITFDGVIDPTNENEDGDTVIVLGSEEDMTIEELKAQKAQLEEQLEEAKLEKEVADMQAELDSIKAQAVPAVEPVAQATEPVAEPKPAEPTAKAVDPEVTPVPAAAVVEDVIDTTKTVAASEEKNQIPAFMQAESKY